MTWRNLWTFDFFPTNPPATAQKSFRLVRKMRHDVSRGRHVHVISVANLATQSKSDCAWGWLHTANNITITVHIMELLRLFLLCSVIWTIFHSISFSRWNFTAVQTPNLTTIVMFIHTQLVVWLIFFLRTSRVLNPCIWYRYLILVLVPITNPVICTYT